MEDEMRSLGGMVGGLMSSRSLRFKMLIVYLTIDL